MNPLTQSKNTTILPVLIALTLACFAFSPQARAVCQEGCLTNENTVLGEDALLNNTTGVNNTATGFNALFNNLGGNNNTATGDQALYSNNGGFSNTANGVDALQFNTTGSENTATGFFALIDNNGSDNTANGVAALELNSEGNNNTAEGFNALLNNSTGSNNIGLGSNAGSNLTTGSNNIDIGALGKAGEANTIRIGKGGVQQNTYIQGISGATVASGATVIVGSNGHLGTIVSSERFKDEIKPMAKASEAVLALKPVMFRYKKELDPEGIPQFGLVAEEVEKVNPDLVARDEEGKPYTVRYEAVNAMLLNEFLKQHRKLHEQEATITRLQKGMERVIARLEEQGAQIQKVSAQLEVSKSVPQMVLKNQR